MQNILTKKYPTVGCCGIDCGLCPRYHTNGASRCPGCLGTNFKEKHPSCSIITCCTKKHGLEICAECDEFICQRLKNWDCADSFVTHRNSLSNLESIRRNGLGAFIKQQNRRIRKLEELIRESDDGKSKSFYCLSVTLLPTDELKEAISRIKKKDGISDRKQIAKMLKDAFTTIARRKNIELIYRKINRL